MWIYWTRNKMKNSKRSFAGANFEPLYKAVLQSYLMHFTTAVGPTGEVSVDVPVLVWQPNSWYIPVFIDWMFHCTVMREGSYGRFEHIWHIRNNVVKLVISNPTKRRLFHINHISSAENEYFEFLSEAKQVAIKQVVVACVHKDHACSLNVCNRAVHWFKLIVRVAFYW